MKLTSLKLSAKEAKADSGIGPVQESDLPKYPYGMSLRLDTDTLKKLGIDLDDYELGEKCTIEARGTVIDTSESQRLGGKERKNLEIQITDLAIGTDKASKKAKANDAHLASISKPTGAVGRDY